MGRRSRKRMTPVDAGPATSRAERDEARRRRAAAAATAGDDPGRRPGTRARGERPAPPWGSFPLSELIVLLALVLGVVGLVTWGDRGRVMLLAAMALGSLAGLELSLREHLAGYRSHSALLAAAVTFAFVVVFLLAAGGGGVALGAVAILAGVVFAAAFWALRELFKSRSGGLGFR